MKGIVCGVCGHIVLAGDAPDNCPVCYAPKEKFTEQDDAIKTAADEANKTEAEEKHTPVIVVVKECGLIPGDCKDVHVKVGGILHPMTPEHLIQWIDYYVDKRFVSRVFLSPEGVYPAAALHVKAQSGKLTVIEHCNLHGAWQAEAEL